MTSSIFIFGAALVAAAPGPNRLALVIANNHSLDENVKPLRFADDDAARLFELLKSLGYDGRLFVILDEDSVSQHPEVASVARPPTWSRLERTLKEFRELAKEKQEAGEEVELLISYSGHGAVGARGDPYINLLDKRLYRGDFFREVVAGVGADFVHVIIDACRARDFVDARGGPDGPDFGRELSLFLAQERRVKHPEVGVVVAESADGETHEWARTRSGVFAHEVFSGLAGAADVNLDGRVEYSELHSFVAAANASIKDPRARLRVVAQPPPVNPRRPLLSLKADQNLERIQTPRAGGWYTIEDDRGVRWVDAHLAEGTQVTIHLPRRSRYFIVDVQKSTEAVLEPRPDQAVVALASLGFEPLSPTASRGSIAEALGSDLFRTPYGAEYYGGFAVAMRYPSVLSDAPATSSRDESLAMVSPGGAESPSSEAETEAPSTVGEPPLPFVPSEWEVGLNFGVGFGTKKNMDKLEEDLERMSAVLGNNKKADFDNRSIKSPSWVLALRGGYRFWDYLSVGGELGFLFWDWSLSQELRSELLNEWGVEPEGRAFDDSIQYLRVGPSIQGSLPIAYGVGAQLTVTGGYWIDLESADRPKNTHGWWIRPTLGAVYAPIERLEVLLDFGYAYLTKLDEYPEPMHGFELMIGAQLLL